LAPWGAVHFIVGDCFGMQVKNMNILFICAIFGVLASIAQTAYIVYTTNRDMDREREDFDRRMLDLYGS